MTSRKPSPGRRVRYVSHGTPLRADGSQAYSSESRPADITEVGSAGVVGLMVINPKGLLFHPLDSGGVPYDGTGRLPGTWHWPEIEENVSVFTAPDGASDAEAS
jgi:hypothetical protein